MKQYRILSLMAAASILFVSCNKDDGYGNNPPPPPPPQIESSVISGAGDLTAALAKFRILIGYPLNSTPGQTTGRREVNWDGVPANFTNANNFPFDFFNITDPNGSNGRKRGLVYTNTGTSFRVDSTSYSEIDASYATEFKPFSGKRLFAYMGSNISEATFKVPGTNTDASVKGFGLVFSDVDDANSTFVEYFNGNKSLGVFKAPTRNDANGFSFLGVFFPKEKITRVKITAGNGVLQAGVKDISAQGGQKDLVVMDDFFYSEPLPINN
jgi:hypothetical protein